MTEGDRTMQTAKAQTRLENSTQGALLFLLCWAVYFASYLGRYNYSAAMGALLEQNMLSLSAAGAVSTAYFFAYGAGQLLNGLVSGRISPYTMIFVGLFCAGAANVVMGCVPAEVMVAVWAVNGFFQSMIWPPIVRLFSEALPFAQQKGACIHITSTTPAGTLVSYGLSALMLTVFVWNGVFWLCGALMMALALLWLPLTHSLRKATQPVGKKIQAEKETHGMDCKAAPKHSFSLLRLFVLSGIVWLLLPVALHGALKDGMSSWVPTCIQENFSAPPAFSAVLAMALPVVNLAGAYLAAWVDRRVFHNEVKTTLALFATACLALGLLPFVLRTGLILTIILLAITTSLMLGINTMLIGVIPVKAGVKGNAAAISGILNAVTYLGAAASTWGIGLFVERLGWTATALLWLGFAGVAVLFCMLPVGTWARYCKESTQ